MKLRPASVVCFSLALATAAACGSNKGSTFMPPGDDAGLTTDSSPMTTAPDAMQMLNGDASGVDACTGTHCSSDLHSVLDCSGDVVKTCPSNEGCSSGGCIAPCDAAAADKSTIGCDYFSVVPDVQLPDFGGCFAAYVANTWDTPVTISVDYNGMTLDASKFGYIPSGTGPGLTYAPLKNAQLPPGQVAILFLNNVASDSALAKATSPFGMLNTACPTSVTEALTSIDAAQHGTGIGHAFHIATSAPVVAYDIYPYGGGQSAITSATLLLPTSAWDTNYIAVDAYVALNPQDDDGGGVDAGTSGDYNPFIDFVAQKDGTIITINPTNDIQGAVGVSVTNQGQPAQYGPFARGELLHIAQNTELTGSIVQSNYPIGAWGGHQCMYVPQGVPACDSSHQQIPPIRALGSEYVAVRYRNRWPGTEESVPWRLVGAVPGTTLTYEPSPPSGAPLALNQGEMVEFNTNGPFVVKSQDAKHPFYMAGYMTGADTNPNGGSDGRGDPEFVNVVPSAEYLSSYTFFTDPTYPETNLVLVRTANNGKFSDVTLDCLGTVTGWMPLGSGNSYEYTRVDLSTGNFQAQGKCNNGRHQMTSKSPFGLTVWGWGSAATGSFYSQFVSYAYPAGQSVAPINTVVVPPVPQ